jgi:parallel beta-helix repeat protein
MIGDGIYIMGEIVDVWNTHSIDTSNAVNGKPVHYWKNQNGGTIPPGAGEIILANCTNVRIEGQDLSNGSVGILLGFSNNNYIVNNTASSNEYNIELSFSEYNTLTNNTVSKKGTGFHFYYSCNNTLTSNKMLCNSNETVWFSWTGISFFWSDFNTIANNDISSRAEKGISTGISVSNGIGNIIINNTISNNWGGITLSYSNSHNITNNNVLSNLFGGIYLSFSSDKNEIIGNTISNNGEYGLRLSSSHGNEIVNNTFFRTDGYGLHLSDSSKNRIYHNNFIDNVDQAYDNMNNNFWNESYPTGGNYWSDFDEPNEDAYDDYQGINQDDPTSGDGIVDLGLPSGGKNPYVIDPDSRDNYPLINISLGLFLYPGWNLISVPLIQSDTNLGAVLSSIKGSYNSVWAYNLSDSYDHWKHYHTSMPVEMNDLQWHAAHSKPDHCIVSWLEPCWLSLEIQ